MIIYNYEYIIYNTTLQFIKTSYRNYMYVFYYHYYNDYNYYYFKLKVS